MKKNSSRSVEMKATAYERNTGVRNAAGRTVIQPSDYLAVVGLDVGDRKTHYCILDLDGDLVVEGEVATREASRRVQFDGERQDAYGARGRGALTVDQPITGGTRPRCDRSESTECADDFPQ